MNNFGVSLYLSSGLKKNSEIVEKAKNTNMKYAFTSLHIPEEKNENIKAEIESLIGICKSNGISLIADIGPRALKNLGYSNLSELKNTPITHLRVDYGFTNKEIVELSKDFNIVFNASTISDEQIDELRKLNANFSKFSACHNFYPKPLTGLSKNKVRKINEKMHRLGMKTIAFTSGDKELRGPLKMGLPTIEEHRNSNVLLNILSLIKDCSTDICLIGDIDISDEAYNKIKELSEGYVSLKAEINPKYEYITNLIHHDRPDSSEYVIRSQESRGYASQGRLFPAEPVKPRKKGSISVGNEGYLRYSGELEIARKDLDPESKVNIIGQVRNDDIKYLDYISDGMGFKINNKI